MVCHPSQQSVDKAFNSDTQKSVYLVCSQVRPSLFGNDFLPVLYSFSVNVDSEFTMFKQESGSVHDLAESPIRDLHLAFLDSSKQPINFVVGNQTHQFIFDLQLEFKKLALV